MLLIFVLPYFLYSAELLRLATKKNIEKHCVDNSEFQQVVEQLAADIENVISEEEIDLKIDLAKKEQSNEFAKKEHLHDEYLTKEDVKIDKVNELDDSAIPTINKVNNITKEMIDNAEYLKLSEIERVNFREVNYSRKDKDKDFFTYEINEEIDLEALKKSVLYLEIDNQNNFSYCSGSFEYSEESSNSTTNVFSNTVNNECNVKFVYNVSDPILKLYFCVFSNPQIPDHCVRQRNDILKFSVSVNDDNKVLSKNSTKKLIKELANDIEQNYAKLEHNHNDEYLKVIDSNTDIINDLQITESETEYVLKFNDNIEENGYLVVEFYDEYYCVSDVPYPPGYSDPPGTHKCTYFPDNPGGEKYKNDCEAAKKRCIELEEWNRMRFYFNKTKDTIIKKKCLIDLPEGYNEEDFCYEQINNNPCYREQHYELDWCLRTYNDSIRFTLEDQGNGRRSSMKFSVIDLQWKYVNGKYNNISLIGSSNALYTKNFLDNIINNFKKTNNDISEKINSLANNVKEYPDKNWINTQFQNNNKVLQENINTIDAKYAKYYNNSFIDSIVERIDEIEKRVELIEKQLPVFDNYIATERYNNMLRYVRVDHIQQPLTYTMTSGNSVLEFDKKLEDNEIFALPFQFTADDKQIHSGCVYIWKDKHGETYKIDCDMQNIVNVVLFGDKYGIIPAKYSLQYDDIGAVYWID